MTKKMRALNTGLAMCVSMYLNFNLQSQKMNAYIVLHGETPP